MPTTPAPADCPYDWVPNRSELQAGWHAEVFDGAQSWWALCPEQREPLSDVIDFPVYNVPTGFCIAHGMDFPSGTCGRSRVHAPDGSIGTWFPFVFGRSQFWDDAPTADAEPYGRSSPQLSRKP